MVRTLFGDVLATMLLYFLLRAFLTFSWPLIAVGVLLFSFTLEGIQYFRIITHFGLQEYTLLTLLLGSTFDPADLLAYTVGVLFATGADIFIFKKR